MWVSLVRLWNRFRSGDVDPRSKQGVDLSTPIQSSLLQHQQSASFGVSAASYIRWFGMYENFAITLTLALSRLQQSPQDSSLRG